MDLPALLFFLALVLVVAAYLARPLLVERLVQPSPEEARRAELLVERETVLAALHELDLDRAMGKLTEEDYQALRAEWLARGAAVLRALDELEAASTAADPEAWLEAEVARRRTARRRDRRCDRCGRAAEPEDRFCAACGAPLAAREG